VLPAFLECPVRVLPVVFLYTSESNSRVHRMVGAATVANEEPLSGDNYEQAQKILKTVLNNTKATYDKAKSHRVDAAAEIQKKEDEKNKIADDPTIPREGVNGKIRQMKPLHNELKVLKPDFAAKEKMETKRFQIYHAVKVKLQTEEITALDVDTLKKLHESDQLTNHEQQVDTQKDLAQLLVNTGKARDQMLDISKLDPKELDAEDEETEELNAFLDAREKEKAATALANAPVIPMINPGGPMVAGYGANAAPPPAQSAVGVWRTWQRAMDDGTKKFYWWRSQDEVTQAGQLPPGMTEAENPPYTDIEREKMEFWNKMTADGPASVTQPEVAAAETNLEKAMEGLKLN